MGLLNYLFYLELKWHITQSNSLLNKVYLHETLIDSEIEFYRVGLEVRDFNVSLKICN